MRFIPQDNSALKTWRPTTTVVKENAVAVVAPSSSNENENVNTMNNNSKINMPMKPTVLGNKNVVLGEKKKAVSPIGPKMMTKGLSYRSLSDPVPEGGACMLVYEPDSSGRLVEHYSTQPLEGMAAVGRWTAGASKKIAPFKFKRNAGRNVLIGNCSAGLLGRKNYCSGWCQFVKSAKVLQGDVTLYDIPSGLKAMPVDVYLYYDDNRPGYQSVKLIPGKAHTTDNLLAVACIPRNTQFYENMTVDILKWLQDGSNHGYSSKC